MTVYIKLLKMSKKFKYPLLDNAFSPQDLQKGINVLRSGQITMSGITKKFEKSFAKYLGVKYALMVNSGSSANLLSVFAACNPYRKNRFKIGDEAIIPVLCWSTSLWPLVQAGLKPRFVDIDPHTLNVKVSDVIKKINNKTKLIMAVHILGGCTEMEKLRNIAKQKKIILIEDTCESLGSKYNKKYLGTFGDFGTYSFYYSHQITSGEGGMVVCNNYEDYCILHSLRSHGWTRGLKLKNIKNSDNKFTFYNSGFNLRPTDVSAAIGLNQFKRLKKFQQIRDENRNKIIKTIVNDKRWKNQFIFQKIIKKCDPSWFGFPIILNKRYIKSKSRLIEILEKNGIETRPIVSGNFFNQPAIKKFKIFNTKEKFENAQLLEESGFFIGLHTKKISNYNLNQIKNNLFKIEEILPKKNKIRIGITGHNGVLGSAFIKNFHTKFEFIKYDGDVTNYLKLKKWFDKLDVENFLHFAAKVPTNLVERNKNQAKKVNLESVNSIIKLLKENNRIKWFFFPSTSHVYKKSKFILNENSPKEPSSVYANTKLLAEKNLLKFQKQKDVNICIGRIFSYTNYNQKKSFVIPSLFHKIKRNYKLSIEKLRAERDFVHIDDICNAIYLLLTKQKKGIFNISSQKKLKIYEIANLISKQVKNKKIFSTVKSYGNKDILYGDNKRLKNLGWAPKKNINIIIRDFAKKN